MPERARLSRAIRSRSAGKIDCKCTAAGGRTAASSSARRCRAARCCAPATASCSTTRGSLSPWSSAPEPVFVIEPRSRAEWGLFAYHIGNRHQPVMITERAIVCPDVPGVEQLLTQHAHPVFTRVDAAVHAGWRRLPAISTDLEPVAMTGLDCSRCCTCATACFRSAASRTPTVSRRRPRRRGRDGADLRAWIDVVSTRSVGRCDGPAVRAGVVGVARGRTGARSRRSTKKCTRCGRRRRRRAASRAMGARLLTTWQTIHPDRIEPTLTALVRRGTRPDAAGCVRCRRARAAASSRATALEAFAYTRLAATISAAMRLMPIGQTDAHASAGRALDARAGDRGGRRARRRRTRRASRRRSRPGAATSRDGAAVRALAALFRS